MKKDIILSLVLVAVCVISVIQAKWNQTARDHILQLHNDYRRNEGACQMNELVYDMDLEAQAKPWALRCYYEQAIAEGRGQILSYNARHITDAQHRINHAKRWFDQKALYTRGQANCGKSCCYTQLVWDKTEKVGCYSYHCPELHNGDTIVKNAWYQVCFYTPAGNLDGQEPYQLQCDTPCRDGQTLLNGLCVGQAIIPCVDLNEHCNSWQSLSYCKGKYKKYMKKNCRKACKLCVVIPCVDLSRSCSDMQRFGYCKGMYEAYMKRNCRKACKLCK
ncbi:cysteine-rich venom protein [Plakobranchus ocellatus]|uniref:Cysteine-rich venom protein n=1 Tax=Plakobranchus ocellatus TaxID=259542 RepID=A0AAV4C539_9GAST|nr:cysteine-rich venom protein [Plakobranchus ocellatus]